MSGQLITEVNDGIGWLIFDNQEKRNAIGRAMLAEFSGVLAAFADDDAVRVVVLRGAGERAFTAGADISELGDRPIKVSGDNYDEGFGVRELREFPKPIIAMIHGFCMGGGVVMAMGADIRIGSDDSVYCIPVARLGVCYPIAAIDRLNQLVGPAHASDLLFTARHVNADEAARIGLINRVVPKADLDKHVRALAQQIAGNAPLTVRASKVAVGEVARARSERDEAMWTDTMNACMGSDDFIEGRRAFMEKRPPVFKGRQAMDFAQLYDPALDAHVGELRAFNEQFNQRAATSGGDLSTPEGLAKARDLNALMGGLFARDSTTPTTTRQVPGTSIGLRVITPASGTPNALYIDIHGGGFFIGDPTMSDALNASIADAANAVSVSIDYRLAPEHPYPAPPDDCETAALWILENAASEWGVDRFAIGGASAGGNLVAVTLQRLRDRHDAATQFLAANMQFGVYDLSGTPSQIDLGRVAFRDLYLPTTPAAQRKVADISPLYGNLRGMPPALFTVGTLDYLYDDSLFMAARWHAAGNETELAVYPESIHGFTAFPAEMARIASRRIVDFIASRVR